jgi:hypothetical protein
MAGDGSTALGAPQIAGTLVSPRGLTKKMTMRVAGGQVAGLVGSLAAAAATSGGNQGVADAPNFGRIGYLAASETDLALLKTTSLGWRPRPTGDALARVPRSELESLQLEQGKLISHLKLRFSNGVMWEFEIPKANKKGAKQFVATLGGHIT